jgi:predicted lipoprotein with Yx(FWY)xxD motif
MKRLLITGVVLALTAVLAACGGGGGSAGTNASNTSTKTVSVKQVDGAGSVLVASDGQALYASDQETHGKVLCTGACNSFWQPLVVSHAPTGTSLDSKLGLVQRPDGKKQVTYRGKLLYSFTQDQPGQVKGDGFKDAFGGQQFTWHVVHADASAGSPNGPASGSGGYRGY